ncbi:MAG: UspA domain-containing protein [Candidatus Aramenus sulfurataquae]|jgi:nucleotide-binding universal stress UspA family protein|uniref:Universal stress protein n=2 Tax=Candidatus Aramenus sulfurataquae TaxID=1326980 RepID=W7L8L1_9CREN|nr:MAG: UspA domain-containing protein [Candidatus Aramenus sulfurataquae]MCL7343058.1 universal stress protein [Candidatus Aramenus sulfurataquae]
MFSHILVAYDGSENSKRALNVAIELASKYSAKLDVVEVVDSTIFAGAGIAPVPAEVIESVYNKAKSDVEEAKKQAASKGVNAEGVVLEGEPAGAILDYVAKNKVDLIVTGSRGLSTFKRILLGSVSTRIVEEAKIPVLVVK